jgi:phenylalanyl-tRNA synthetase alpha chain
MNDGLESLLSEALDELKRASSSDEALGVRVRYLGRKGALTRFIKGLKDLPESERKAAGERLNRAKEEIEAAVDGLVSAFVARDTASRLAGETLDVTLPGRRARPGSTHPVTQVMRRVEEIFTGMGFDVAEGPEVELDRYNFEALNFPRDHPARDMQDTFFIGPDVLLRTHTSPVQIRVMEKERPPLRMLAPGAVYRRDSDVTHSPMFHQVEGFMVDSSVRFSDLKGVLSRFLKEFFGEGTDVRFRPSYFPFTEPSAEIDIRCVICGAEGNGAFRCRVCKGSGWLEILGAGMIHPAVLRAVNYDPEALTGFAFGLGVERLAMLKFGIDDLRLLFENDARFLRQF